MVRLRKSGDMIRDEVRILYLLFLWQARLLDLQIIPVEKYHKNN